MMLKKMLLFCLCLMLTLSVFAVAEVDDEYDLTIAEEEYRYIESMFDEATVDGKDYWETLGLFKKIISEYEKYKEVQDKGKAFLYYSYAQGMVNIDQNEYETAALQFTSCGDIAYAKEYMNYANGMIYKQNDLYLNAIDAFDAAMKCDNIASAAAKQKTECLALYKEYVLKLGDTAFEEGDYETALGYYEKLMSQNQADPEGMKRYNICLSRINQTELPQIEVVSERLLSSRQFEMNYTTREETIDIFLHMQIGNPVLVEDLVSMQAGADTPLILETTNADDQGWKITGLNPSQEYTIQFNGLLPNTDYRVQLIAKDCDIVVPIKTEPAPENTLLHAESVTGRHYNEGKYQAALKNLKEGASVWNALIKNGELFYTDGNDLSISDGTLGKEEYCLQLRMGDDENLSKEDIAGKVCQLIIHVDELGTIAMEPTVCGEENCPLEVQRENDKYMMLEITDVLKAAVEKYPEAVEHGYSLDCLLDGFLLFSINGKLI